MNSNETIERLDNEVERIGTAIARIETHERVCMLVINAVCSALVVLMAHCALRSKGTRN